jgi:hypothetical protein
VAFVVANSKIKIEDFRALFWARSLVIDPTLFPPRPPLPSGLHDELGAGICNHKYDPVHLDDLGKECAFIRDAIATGGASYANPLWNLTTLAATFSDDPRNDAHRMGNKHPHLARRKGFEPLTPRFEVWCR